jgi:hypothetical protein
MTEAEWLGSDNPQELVEFLSGRTTARKRRLLAASFCRHFLPLIRQSCVQRAVTIAERYADGLASLEGMLAISEQVLDAYVNVPNPSPPNTDLPLSRKAESITIQTAFFLTQESDSYDFLLHCCQTTDLAASRWAMFRAGAGEALPYYPELVQWQFSLIDDLIGNPFRSVCIDHAWLTPDVARIAQVAYDERDLPEGTLQTDRLAILADALEEAGCTDAAILDHLRGPGPHVRGCWVIDLLLGKS